MFDLDDWVDFDLTDPILTHETSLTNAVLGTHNFGTLTYNFTENWEEDNLPFDSSLPDKSREVIFNQNYNVGSFGNLEVCSLTLNTGILVTVPELFYVRAQISVTVNPGATLDIQNDGSLIMVKDSYNGVSGPDLVNLNGGTVNITKRTNGLDAYSDYVFWSTPLTSNAINKPLNSLENLFPAGVFSRNYFTRGINANYYDGTKYVNGSIVAGYDDNNDFWFRPFPSEANELMLPSQGYAVLAPLTGSDVTSANPLGWNYSINFRGQANNGIVHVPTYKNNSSYSSNSNLVGNPYPSAIDFNRLFEVNTNLIYPYAWVWGRTPLDVPTFSNGPYGYGDYYSTDNFLLYSAVMTIPSTNPFGNILSSCQSFYVSTRKELMSPLNNTGLIEDTHISLIFNNSMRSTNTNNTFARQTNSAENESTKIWLSIKDEKQKMSSEIGIVFSEKYINGYDDNQDVKFFFGRPLNLYTIADKQNLIIDARSAFNDAQTISLGLNNLTESTKLTLNIEKTTGQLAGHDIYVFDKATSKIINLTKESYVFESKDKIADDRFTILFQNKIVSEIGDNDNTKVVVFAKDGLVTVNSLTDKKIQTVNVQDLYTPSVGGIDIAKNDNINNKQFSFNVDSNRYRLLNIRVVLEDGTVVNKKVIP